MLFLTLLMKMKSYSVQEAKQKLERYCAYQERCHQEVERKLAEMNMIPEAQEMILLHLIKHDFLNESRFALAFASGKFTIKKWGKQRLRRELKHRDISDYNIRLALNSIDDQSYQVTFDALAKKRFDQLQESNRFKKRKKLADYLLYRGWESGLVYDKVVELIP